MHVAREGEKKVGRFWSLLFLMVPVLGVLAFVFAASPDSKPFLDHWLPLNINEQGYVIDDLFMFILYLTGVIFIITGVLLFRFLWKYDAANNSEPVKYVHGNHSLEIIWSILPAITLLFIAIYQMDAWAEHKMRRPLLEDGSLKPALAQVTARQFEWRIRYAGPDEQVGTPDDIHIVNELHVPVDEDVVLQVQSEDVLHSFFLPNLRIKQDLVPGMRQFSWFHANQGGIYDLVCAELCGWGHYKMRGRLVVESREDFDAWLLEMAAEQERTQPEPAADGEDE